MCVIGLMISRYVRDILKNTPRSFDQVTIEPSGAWSTAAKTETPGNDRPSVDFDSDDDDELIELREDRVTALKNGGSVSASQPATPAISTPGSSSFYREPSAAPSSIRRPSSKRPASEVVDLTLSDDDEEPVRPVKRQYLPASGLFEQMHHPPLYGSGNDSGSGGSARTYGMP